MMIKNILRRVLLGFPIGVTIGLMISIVISFFAKDGNFYAIRPEMQTAFGSELTAFTVQSLLCGLMGSIISAATLIYAVERWSMLLQTVLHAVALIAGILLPAYFCYWMAHTFWGIFQYILIFIGIYIAIWFAQYFSWKAQLKQLNAGLK